MKSAGFFERIQEKIIILFRRDFLLPQGYFKYLGEKCTLKCLSVDTTVFKSVKHTEKSGIIAVFETT